MILSDAQIKELLVKSGVLDAKGIQEIETFAKNSNATLTDALIEKDIISDENLGIIIADYLKIPFVALNKLSIPEDVFHIVPERIARKYKVIAYAREPGLIKIAMENPKNTIIQEMIAKKTNTKIAVNYATERDISNTLHIFRRDIQKTFDELLGTGGASSRDFLLSGAPIAKIVDLLIDYAYQDKASDIHIEPEEKNSLIRFRIDGILHDMITLPKALHDQITTRIKVLSRLRTDEHLSPQDGKMRIKLAEENLDIRVSMVPIVDGEKVVLRLLSSHFRQFSLIDLGMAEKDLKKIQRAFSKSFGMILSTGPTGSGKTTSIYAILKILNTREKNITTVEDPVEYRIKGVNQIQANPKTNLTFASGLRSILRQDPNIVFVGEIRDNETAGIAVNAALTGHLVLSTLHTNDAATALPRLSDMQIEPFLIASTVNIIIGQRLLRKICEMCKASFAVSEADLTKHIPPDVIKKQFGGQKEIRLYQGKGCKICHNTGYSGRIGIFEVLEISNGIRDLIVKKIDSEVIFKAAQAEGMTSMFDDGLQKVQKGLTTIQELLRVTKVESL